MSDLIQTFVDRAHQVLNQTSTYEVIDLDKDAARARILEMYGLVNSSVMEEYLNVVDQLREVLQ